MIDTNLLDYQQDRYTKNSYKCNRFGSFFNFYDSHLLVLSENGKQVP